MEQNATTPPTDDDVLATRRRRLLFRATHRGTFETDLLIGGFVERRVADMDAAALDAMEAILEIPDPDLADWLTGRLELPAERETPLLRAMVDESRVMGAGTR